MSNMKINKLKMGWERPYVELYENDPRKVAQGNDIVTSIFVPIK
jgi:hypothetical protein